MLMIQKMLGYVDSRPETNEQTGTGGNYMVANGLGCEWQVGPGGPVGPGNGIRRACAG
jgi:hypothetical protein